MSINEIFPNPTVKKVIFQIRFPNLFYLENKIGDLQIKIMKEFPQSSLIVRRQLVFADVGDEVKTVTISRDIDQESGGGKKIWQFKSDKNYELNILTDALDITSEYHKTYRLGDGENFRDIIEFVLARFFELTEIPHIHRIGLRYIDVCPLPKKDNHTLKAWYNSTFPIDRFDLSDANEMFFKTVVKRGDYHLIYMETLKQVADDKYALLLDFDGFAENVAANTCMSVTDALHDMIITEFQQTIKDPVYQYMRQKEEVV